MFVYWFMYCVPLQGVKKGIERKKRKKRTLKKSNSILTAHKHVHFFFYCYCVSLCLSFFFLSSLKVIKCGKEGK